MLMSNDDVDFVRRLATILQILGRIASPDFLALSCSSNTANPCPRVLVTTEIMSVHFESLGREDRDEGFAE